MPGLPGEGEKLEDAGVGPGVVDFRQVVSEFSGGQDPYSIQNNRRQRNSLHSNK